VCPNLVGNTATVASVVANTVNVMNAFQVGGVDAFYIPSDDQSVAVGLSSLPLVSLAGATANTAVGTGALGSNTNGANNVAVGQNALHTTTGGSSNVAVGQSSGLNLVTGTGNVCLGRNAGVVAGGGAISNCVVLGTSAQATASNQLVIAGTLQGTATLVGGTVTVTAANVTSTTQLFVNHKTISGTPGTLSWSSAIGSFTVTSTSGTDTSLINYFGFETTT